MVAIDRKNSLKLMSFQELSSRERGRKGSLVAVDKIKVFYLILFLFLVKANHENIFFLNLLKYLKYDPFYIFVICDIYF